MIKSFTFSIIALLSLSFAILSFSPVAEAQSSAEKREQRLAERDLKRAKRKAQAEIKRKAKLEDRCLNGEPSRHLPRCGAEYDRVLEIINDFGGVTKLFDAADSSDEFANSLKAEFTNTATYFGTALYRGTTMSISGEAFAEILFNQCAVWKTYANFTILAAECAEMDEHARQKGLEAEAVAAAIAEEKRLAAAHQEALAVSLFFETAQGGEAVTISANADSHIFDIKAGGADDLNTRAVVERLVEIAGWNRYSCGRYINFETPHARINVANPDPNVKLNVTASSKAEISVIVRRPDGVFACDNGTRANKDPFEATTVFTDQALIEGEYLVWISTNPKDDSEPKSYKAKAKLSITGNYNNSIPAPAMRNQTLEAFMLQAALQTASNNNWSETPRFAYLSSTQWTIAHNFLNQAISHRGRDAYVGAEWPDNHCSIQKFRFSQPYIGGSFDEASTYLDGTGGQYDVACDDFGEMLKLLN